VPSLLAAIAIALGLGLLVGLQREWVSSELAGIRTFPLVTVFGTISGALAATYGGWVLAAGVLAVALLLVMGNITRLRTGPADPGITTETAVLLMYGVGAALVSGFVTAALVTAGSVAVLLHWKEPLHAIVGRIGRADAQAIFRMALIALVILPIVPNRTIGPYAVLNPFNIWLMVVLIVGISMGAYVAYKLLGRRSGTLIAGLMGGLISSTATTVSISRRSRGRDEEAGAAALVIVIASTVVFGRVLIEIGIVAPEDFGALSAPVFAMLGVMAVLCLSLFASARRSFDQLPEEREPPSDLGAAIVFGLLYGAVLLGIAAARARFGQIGMYVVAGLSGLTDMDAITLSTAQLVRNDDLGPQTGWRLILIGALANLVFKGGLVMALGAPRLRVRIATVFLLALAAGSMILLVWPT